MSAGVPIGDRIDALGVAANVQDGDLIEAAVVLLKVVDAEGCEVVRCAWSDGMSWITRRGMVETARDMEITNPEDREGDDS